MKITGIRQQQKHRGRYSIYIDTQYAFSLSESDLIKTGLGLNQEISKNELNELQDESRLGKAYDRAVNFISIRPRSEFEITQYLRRKDYEPEIIAKVSQKLQKIELINDTKFAKSWAEWRIGLHKSKRQIHSELIKKRVSKEIIEEVLGGIDNTTELESIKILIEQKVKLTNYQDKQKLIALLARRGYGYGLIKQAIAELNL